MSDIVARVKFEYAESDARREMESEMPYSWCEIAIVREAEYVYSISAWCENIYGSTDALYDFQDKYLHRHGGQVMWESAEDAINFAVKAMTDEGYTRQQRRIKWNGAPRVCGNVWDQWLLQTQKIESQRPK